MSIVIVQQYKCLLRIYGLLEASDASDINDAIVFIFWSIIRSD